MKRILILIIGLIGVAQAQYAPTSAKSRFVNGLALGTKLDSYFNAADSNALYWRADSVVMAKYKGTARRLLFASDSTIYFDKVVRTFGNQTVDGNKNFTDTLTAKTIFVDSASGLPDEDDAIYINTTEYDKRIGRGIKAVLNWNGGLNAFGSTAIEGQSRVVGDLPKDHSNVFQSFGYKEGTGRMQYFSNYFASKVLSNNNIGRWYGYYYNSGSGGADSSWSFFSQGGDPMYISSKIAVADSTLPTASIPYPLFVSKPFEQGAFGITSAQAGLFSNNFFGVSIGGVLALGGRTGLSSDPYPFAFIRGAKSDLTTYGGFLSFHTSSDGVNAGEVNGGNYERMRIKENGQVMIGDTTALGGDIKLSIRGGRTYVQGLISDITEGGFTQYRKNGTNVMIQGVKSGIIGSDNGAATFVYGENPYDIYINGVKNWGIDSLGYQMLFRTPLTSSGSYDFLTRNSTTGRTELIAADSMVKPSSIGTTIQPYNANTTIQGNSVTGTGSLVKAISPTLSGSVLVTSSDAATNFTIDNTGGNFGSNIALKKDGTTNGFFGTVGALLGTSDLSLAAYATSGNGFKVYTNGNNLRIDATSNGETVFYDSVKTTVLRSTQILGVSSTPSISGGSATYIGTGATTSVSGNDMAGVITLITGTGCSSTGASNENAFTVTFSSAYANQPIVLINAIVRGGLTSTDAPTSLFFLRRAGSGTGSFTVYIPLGTTLPDNTTYDIFYHVIGR